jgi:hypothetical protein
MNSPVVTLASFANHLLIFSNPFGPMPQGFWCGRPGKARLIHLHNSPGRTYKNLVASPFRGAVAGLLDTSTFFTFNTAFTIT